MDKTEFVFFRRIFAFLIDYLFVFSICFGICNLFFNQLIVIDNYCILIGFFIFILYFGLLNSKITKGQTLGKKIFKIKTVDKNNNFIFLNKSLIRSILIFINLIFINNIYIFTDIVNKANDTAFGISLFVLLSNILLFLLNAPSRKLLHDIILNTVVVDEKTETISDCNICNYGKFYLPNGYFNMNFSAFKICLFIIIISALSSFLIIYNKYTELWHFYSKEETITFEKNINELSSDMYLSSYQAWAGYIKEYDAQGNLLQILIRIKNPDKLSKEEINNYSQKIERLAQKDFKSFENKKINVYFYQRADLGLYKKFNYLN